MGALIRSKTSRMTASSEPTAGRDGITSMIGGCMVVELHEGEDHSRDLDDREGVSLYPEEYASGAKSRRKLRRAIISRLATTIWASTLRGSEVPAFNTTPCEASGLRYSGRLCEESRFDEQRRRRHEPAQVESGDGGRGRSGQLLRRTPSARDLDGQLGRADGRSPAERRRRVTRLGPRAVHAARLLRLDLDD